MSACYAIGLSIKSYRVLQQHGEAKEVIKSGERDSLIPQNDEADAPNSCLGSFGVTIRNWGENVSNITTGIGNNCYHFFSYCASPCKQPEPIIDNVSDYQAQL